MKNHQDNNDSSDTRRVEDDHDASTLLSLFMIFPEEFRTSSAFVIMRLEIHND